MTDPVVSPVVGRHAIVGSVTESAVPITVPTPAERVTE
jgi:hypothetical protein